jgi:hypothetical protein
MYRQGDILVVPILSLPPAVKPLPRDPALGAVLAFGEATGHAHAIREHEAVLYVADNNEPHSPQSRFLSVGGAEPVPLRHEEHAWILLPPGHYRVVRQRTFVPHTTPRLVAD